MPRPALLLAAVWLVCTAGFRFAPPDSTHRALPEPVSPPQGFLDAVARGTRTLDGRPGAGYWQQQARYRLTARLLPEQHRLEGTAQIEYTNASPDTLYAVYLQLVQNVHQPSAVRNEEAEPTGGISLEKVEVGGEEARFQVDGTRMAILPGRLFTPGQTLTMKIAWSFTIPQAGASGRMGYSRDNLFMLAYWYPVMAVYDDVDGWHLDPFLGTGEFYNGFSDYDVEIEAPANWLVAATGTLQNAADVLAPAVLARRDRAYASDSAMVVVGPDDFGRATRPGAGTLRWRFHASNVRDFAFSATNASIWEAARVRVGDQDGNGTDDYAIAEAFYRPEAQRWRSAVYYAQQALSFHSGFTGFVYPWPHMTVVEGADIISGGMEYPMMSLIGDYTLSGDEALRYVVSHEIGHMWVPMIAGSDERRYGWLDEGCTTFLENESRRPANPNANPHLGEQMQYLALAREGGEGEIMRWSDFHYTNIAYFSASYSKPSTLLVALRAILGDEAFRRGYQQFIRDWAYRHPYPSDFFLAFERASGRKLGWFWRPWYYETWTLDQALASVRTHDGRTDITIEDRGRAPMPVRLAVTLTDGQVVRREVPVDVWLSGARSTSLAIDGTATRISIDPEGLFPDINRANNVWSAPSVTLP